MRMQPLLHVVTDYDDTPDDEPTRPGDFETPGHLTEERAVHRIVCPHHTIPWVKVIAINVAIAAATLLVACGLR